MLLKEFVSETNKNQMMAELFKYYKVEGTRMKYKSMKDHAHYVVEDGVLLLSKRYKTLKPSQIKEFLITMIHEIKHAMDRKKFGGGDAYQDAYEMEQNMQISNNKHPYKDNKYEIAAEKFGQREWKRWSKRIGKVGVRK